jgi:hypothetical protein
MPIVFIYFAKRNFLTCPVQVVRPATYSRIFAGIDDTTRADAVTNDKSLDRTCGRIYNDPNQNIHHFLRIERGTDDFNNLVIRPKEEANHSPAPPFSTRKHASKDLNILFEIHHR